MHAPRTWQFPLIVQKFETTRGEERGEERGGGGRGEGGGGEERGEERGGGGGEGGEREGGSVRVIYVAFPTFLHLS